MTIKPLIYGFGVVLTAVVFAACQATPKTEAPVEEMPPVEEVETTPEEEAAVEMNVVETAQAAGQFNTLLQLATAAGLADALSTQNVTVFAPTDEAFAAVPAATLKALQEDPEKLAEVLKFHVVSGAVPSTQLAALGTVTTLQGQTLPAKITAQEAMIGDAVILQADIMASNGVIHVIDRVMLPELDESAVVPSVKPTVKVTLSPTRAIER